MELYVVKRGDSLYQIARRFSVPMDDIVTANQLQNPEALSVGQALLIPAQAASHTVQRGESLYRIAERYGVPLQRLIAANPQITNPDRIYPGQILRIPSGGEEYGEILVNGYMTAASDGTLLATLPYLSFLSPFSYRLDREGNLTRDESVNEALSRDARVGNLLTVTNLKPEGGFSSDIAHAVLGSEEIQAHVFSQLEELLEKGDWYGVGLDLEYVYPFDRDNYNRFLEALTARMHRLGKIVVTALAPKISDSQQGLLYTAHDYAFHGKTADFVVLMTYEWGYTYGPAMAVSPINRVRQVLDYAVSVMPAGKILLGVPNYGYDWTLPFTQGSAARALTNVQATTLAGQAWAEIRYDSVSQAPFFRYNDSAGRLHEVWFEDARSLRAKFRLVPEYGLGGLSFWNLNNLYRTIFLLLDDLFTVEKVE